MRPESGHLGENRHFAASKRNHGKVPEFPRLSHKQKRENSTKEEKMNKKVAATIRKWWNWLNYGSLPLKIYGWTIKSITTLQSIIDLITMD